MTDEEIEANAEALRLAITAGSDVQAGLAALRAITAELRRLRDLDQAYGNLARHIQEAEDRRILEAVLDGDAQGCDHPPEWVKMGNDGWERCVCGAERTWWHGHTGSEPAWNTVRRSPG